MHFPEEKCIIDLMDCLSYHYLLRSKHSGTNGNWFYDMEYRRLKKYEEQTIEKYKTVLVISNKDKALLPGDSKKVQVIGNGVDIRPKLPVKETFDLLFLGNLTYIPNIIAARFLIQQVLPLLHKEDPDIRIAIAGKNPVKELLNYSSEQVIIIQDPVDTLTVFSAAKLFVAPMFLSTGIQNKILEAMAAGIPIITSPNAADAIGAVNGIELLTAVSPREFATQVLRLIKDSSLQNSLIINGKQHVEKNFNWQHSINLLGKIL